jgi:hypothetical protein
MKYLSYGYRFALNFILLVVVYLSLNFVENYEQRTMFAALVMVYASMRSISGIRSIYLFGRVERLEKETGRLIKAIDAAASVSRLAIINDVTGFRKESEARSYIDTLFHVMIALLCVSKIVAN